MHHLGNPGERTAFEAGMRSFRENCSEEFGAVFHELTTDDQTAHLQALSDKNDVFFGQLKELVIYAYFTSEIGMTQALEYNPILESYDGKVAVTDLTRAKAAYLLDMAIQI